MATKVLGIRLTDEERHWVDRAALEAGQPTTEWARRTLLAATPRTAVTAEVTEWLDKQPPERQEALLEAAAPAPRRPSPPRRPKDASGAKCTHPPNRRIGKTCALCGVDP